MGRIAVIGTVFIDVKGFPAQNYAPTGRNVGRVCYVHGGVFRNIAEDMANLGQDVSFITALDEAFGPAVRVRLERGGVDLSYAVTAPECMGMWLAVFDERGDLAGSISQQPDFDPIEAVIDARGDEIISACDAVALEMDMRASISEKVLKLARKYGKDVYVAVGNLSVICQHPELLPGVRMFILNEIEATRLFECEVDPEDPQEALAILRREAQTRGIREMIITLGKNGAVYYSAETGESGHTNAERVRMVDSTGAGDAFFTAAAVYRSRGLSLRESCRRGAHLAALTIESVESACPRLTDEDFEI